MKFTKLVTTGLLLSTNILYADTPNSLGEVEIIGSQDSAYEKTEGYLTTKSATGSKMDVDITEIPQSISIVTKDLMEMRDSHTIQKVLAYTAAIVQPYGENEDTRYNWSKIRGSTMYGSTFLDGLRLGYDGFGVPKTDMYAVEKVEVLKGPASALYGASAPGGLLNLQSKRANNSEDKELVLSTGSSNRHSIALDMNHTLAEDTFVRLTTKYTTEEEIEEGYEKEKAILFNPALKYYINDDTTLDVLASYSKERLPGGLSAAAENTVFTYQDEIEKYKDVFASFSPFITPDMIQAAVNKVNDADLDTDLVYGQGNDTLDRRTLSLTTLLNHKINDDLEINSNLRVLKLDGEYIGTSFDGDALTSFLFGFNYTTIPLKQTTYEFELENIALDNNLQYKWDTKNIQNTSMIGLDIQKQKALDKREEVSYNFDLTDPDYSMDLGDTKIEKNLETTTTRLGLYAQNQAKINDKIILSTSLRYDSVKQENNNKLASDYSSQTDSEVTGRLGLGYVFDNGVTPYASYATSFVTNQGTDADGNSYVPSLGNQIELGAKYRIDSINAFLSTAIFRIEEDNILTTDPTDTDYSVQNSDSVIKGFEIDMTIKPIENLNIIISYAKTDSKADSEEKEQDGEKLEFLADNNFSIWSDYTFRKTKIGDLNIGAGIKYLGKNRQYVDDSFNTSDNSAKLTETDAYTIVDARIGTTYKDVTLALNVSNVFDRNAKVNITPTDYKLTQGRTYNFSLKYKF